jgi:alpha-tubulin suppressor-like RCC1 family protein
MKNSRCALRRNRTRFVLRVTLLACLGVALPACRPDDIFYPKKSGPAALVVAYSVSAAASNTNAQPDRVSVTVLRSTGIAYNDTIPFPAGQNEVRVRIELELQQESEDFTLRIDLLEGTRVVAQGEESITMRQGETTVVSLLADDVADNLAVGTSHACMLTPAHDAYCWGGNYNGQLGIGSTTGSTRPVLVSGGHKFVAIDAGVFHTCALTESGEAYCWGSSTFGQLGTGSFQTSNVPAPVSGGLRFRQISTGALHTCGLTISGEAYCWGDNRNGGLASAPSSSAVPLPAASTLRFEKLNAGFWQTCGISTGELYCWGRELGGGTAQLNIPTVVPGGVSFQTISPGTVHTCGTAAGGAAYCWGGGSSLNWGQLGTGSMAASQTPVQVSGGIAFQTVLVSRANTFLAGHTCGLTQDGTAYCWGLNRTNQLGSNTGSCPNGYGVAAYGSTLPCSPVPIAVSGGHRFATIALGNESACGLASDGFAYCWGFGALGVLGQGDLDNRAAPSRVGAPIAPPVITAITINAPRLTLNVGDTMFVSASAVDQHGLPSLNLYQWTSSDTIALSSSSRLPSAGTVLTARLPGSAQLSASAEGRTETITISVSAASVQGLSPLPCNTSAVSLNGNTPTILEFVNFTRQPIRRVWIDYNGAEVDYGTIQPGDRVAQGTYLTHPWRVYGADGTCYGLWMPVPGTGTIYVR